MVGSVGLERLTGVGLPCLGWQGCMGWLAQAVLAGSWLADVAGLAKLMGRMRCVGGRSWMDCQDWKVEHSFCCQDGQDSVDCQDC